MKGDVPKEKNREKLRREIRENFKECIRSRDLRKLDAFMNQCSKKMNHSFFRREFDIALAEEQEQFTKLIPYLEPRYSIIRDALEKVKQDDPDALVDAIQNPPDKCLSRDEMFSSYISIKRDGKNLKELEIEDRIERQIQLIQRCWSMYLSQKFLLEYLLDITNNTALKAYVMEEIKLTPRYKFIRNAGSHIRIRNLPEERMVILRNYNPNPKIDRIDWEEPIEYDKFEQFFHDLLIFNNAFSAAEKNVTDDIYFSKYR